MESEPSNTSKKSTLLINGYTRNQQNYVQQIIPSTIIELLFNFYFVENEYTWKISDESLLDQIKNAKSCQQFKSPLFSLHNLRWQLEVWPNGQTRKKEGNVQLYCCLKALSPKIHTIQYEAKYTFVELDITYIPTTPITQKLLYTAGWTIGTVKTDQLQTCNQLTFKFEFDIDGMFDNDGNDITYHFLHNKTNGHSTTHTKLDFMATQIEKLFFKMDKMEKRINDIEMKVNEEQKHNYNELVKEICVIKQTVNKLAMSDVNSEQKKLKLWLEEIKLSQYFELFIENGIEDLTTVSLLKMEEIKRIGIDKIGHQVKLLHQIAALKQNIQQEFEGTTAYV